MHKIENIKDVYGGSPELVSLVLIGALAVLEDDAPNMIRIFQEQGKAHMAQCLENVMTALRWASLQVERMIPEGIAAEEK